MGSLLPWQHWSWRPRLHKLPLISLTPLLCLKLEHWEWCHQLSSLSSPTHATVTSDYRNQDTVHMSNVASSSSLAFSTGSSWKVSITVSQYTTLPSPLITLLHTTMPKWDQRQYYQHRGWPTLHRPPPPHRAELIRSSSTPTWPIPGLSPPSPISYPLILPQYWTQMAHCSCSFASHQGHHHLS